MRLDTLGTLLDIRDAAQFAIDVAADRTIADYIDDRLVRQAIERNFITIGEAINNLRRHDPDTLSRISRVSEIVGMRNVLIHGYREIKNERVWATIRESLPHLLGEVEDLLKEGEHETAERTD